MTFNERLDGYELRPQHPARYSSTEGETHQKTQPQRGPDCK